MLLLREERIRQGLSANQLAANVGIDRTTITHLEADTGRPTLWVLLKLAGGLDVRLGDIINQAD
ncbi:helix-turn-helix domain-containing protein [Prosthecobacter dejongeii]|uniref:helix-turn-helix domain-containing protein n=1 Tax=Prosthecobacter dejongeii TaxID=48465 RepID=UPI00161E4524